MNNRIITYLFILFSFALAIPLKAQQVRLNTASAKYATTLKPEDQKKIILSIEKFILDYAEAATLIDPKKRRVTSESIKKFQNFFNPRARVIKDYEEFSQNISTGVRDYSDQIFNRMLREGLKVKIMEAKLIEIKYDLEGYWLAYIEVEKAFYNAATEGQEVKNMPGGEFRKQLIQLDIRASDFERIKIASIKCIGCDVEIVDNYVRFMGPSIGLHSGSYNPSLSAYWNNMHSAGTFNTSGGLGFSLGVDFLTNGFLSKGSAKKNLFLTAGVRYSLYSVSTEVSDFALSPFPAIATRGMVELDYMRSAREIEFTEDLTVSLLEVPLGIAYRLTNKNKSSFFLGLQLIPSFVLSGSGNIDGQGTYDADIAQAMWRLWEKGATNSMQVDEPTQFGPFEAGDPASIDETANPSTAGFALSARISPTYYFHLAEEESSWSILVGLDLNFHLGSFFSHDDADSDILKFADDYDSSFLQHYTDGMSGISYGLRIGLHHRFDRRP